MLYEKQRAEVAETALGLLTTGLIVNTSGNVSIRVGEHVVITPSGRDYKSLTPRDIAVVDLKGNVIDGEMLPSSETPLHMSVYASNQEVGAIVHAHSIYATAISTVLDLLPTIHYQMVDLGGAVPVAPYRTFGTDELAEVTSQALLGRSAVIMKNHGSLTTADTIDKALGRCVTLEWCSKVYLKALSAGSPNILSDDEMALAKKQMENFEEKRRAFTKRS
ncbi:MAG: class II aldolase/adducin family protein [Gammaproteobacteria bacterium]|nr:MAG: class II aldolase/adducin family protein [Gammaproteobacteria bacterium]RLA37314.1 MAG: class II aldolase/adducin family protein [Gammaproteobacteria bacterium]